MPGAIQISTVHRWYQTYALWPASVHCACIVGYTMSILDRPVKCSCALQPILLALNNACVGAQSPLACYAILLYRTLQIQLKFSTLMLARASSSGLMLSCTNTAEHSSKSSVPQCQKVTMRTFHGFNHACIWEQSVQPWRSSVT